MKEIVSIAGSPSRTAKSANVLRYIQMSLASKGWQSENILVRDLPAEDLLHARLDSAAIQEAHALIDGAKAIIVATPVYKAAYSGILKAFLDLLPQDALKGKIVLPLATGGSQAHLLAIDYALKPVLGALGATHILRGVYLLDTYLQIDAEGNLLIEAALEQRLQEALQELDTHLQAQIAPLAVRQSS